MICFIGYIVCFLLSLYFISSMWLDEFKNEMKEKFDRSGVISKNKLDKFLRKIEEGLQNSKDAMEYYNKQIYIGNSGITTRQNEILFTNAQSSNRVYTKIYNDFLKINETF